MYVNYLATKTAEFRELLISVGVRKEMAKLRAAEKMTAISESEVNLENKIITFDYQLLLEFSCNNFFINRSKFVYH